MTTFELVPAGPFSLGASSAFLEGFSPAAYQGAEEGHLHLAFVPDGEEAAAGVCLRQPDGAVVGEGFGEADPEAVRDQVTRILSLDVDGRHAFPGPSRLAALEGFPGLFDRKVENLRALGEEAATGRLDGAHLRGLPRDQALAELKQLKGIGDFSAELVLLRGAGDPDHLPGHEPRLSRAAAIAYGLDQPPDQAWLEERAEAWRPYRTWVVLLLRVLLETETGEIGGTRDVGGRRSP